MKARWFASCSGKSLQHRLEPDEPDPEPARVLARHAMRLDEVDAGDRVQLAAALVEHQLDVAERLEAGAEARLRAPDALRDRSDPAALERVQVEDAIGLAEPQRAQDDGLGLVASARHPCGQV